MSGLHISSDSIQPYVCGFHTKFTHAATFGVLALALQACEPSEPSLGGASPLVNTPVQGSAAPLSDQQFNALSLDDQYG